MADINTLIQQAMAAQAPDPGQEDRLRALRRQQAVGLLGTMGGANVGQFGQNLYSAAQQEIGDIEAQRGTGLDRTVKALQAAKAYKDLTADPMAGKAQWDIKPDPVSGGFLRVNKYTGEVQPVAGFAPGGGEEVPFDPDAPFQPIPKGLKESEGKAFFQAQTAAEAFSNLQNLLDSGYEPGVVADTMYRTGGAGLTGRPAAMLSEPGDQMFVSNGIKVAEAILRAQTGAAAPEHEVRTYALTYLPQWYESKEVQQNKMRDLKSTIKALAARAGPVGGRRLQPILEYHLEQGGRGGQKPVGPVGTPQGAAGTEDDPIPLD